MLYYESQIYYELVRDDLRYVQVMQSQRAAIFNKND